MSLLRTRETVVDTEEVRSFYDFFYLLHPPSGSVLNGFTLRRRRECPGVLDPSYSKLLPPFRQSMCRDPETTESPRENSETKQETETQDENLCRSTTIVPFTFSSLSVIEYPNDCTYDVLSEQKSPGNVWYGALNTEYPLPYVYNTTILRERSSAPDLKSSILPLCVNERNFIR